MEVSAVDGEVTIFWTTSSDAPTKLRWDLHDHTTYAGFKYDPAPEASTSNSRKHSRSLRNLPRGDYTYAICTTAACSDAPYKGTFRVGVTGDDTNTLLDGITTNGSVITAAASFAVSAGSTRAWFAGDFTRVGYAASEGIGVSSLGKALPGSPSIDGDVTAVTDDGAGGWYIGGEFTHVGGVAMPNVAHILADGGVDLSFRSAGLSAAGKILALDYDDRGNKTSSSEDVYFAKPRLYVGGDFTWGEKNTTTDTAQRDIVALNTVSQGADDGPGSVLNDFYAEVHDGSGEVRTILVDPSAAPKVSNKSSDESRYIDNAGVYIGGTFTSIDARHPDANDDIIDVDVGMVTKLEPNGDFAVGMLYGNATLTYKGYFWVPPSSYMTSVDSLALYKTGGNGPTFPEATMAYPAKLIVGGEFTKIASVTHDGNGYGAETGRDAANLAAIDSVMGTADNQCYRRISGSGCPLARPVDLQANGAVKHIAVATNTATPSADDRLYVAGAFTQIKTTAALGFGEYALGTNPSSWNPTAPGVGKINGAMGALQNGGTVTSMSVVDTAPKRLYVAGTFDAFLGQSRRGIARLIAPGGTLDTWNPGARFDASQKLVAHSNGQAFVAGDFTMVNSVASNSIASITVDSVGATTIDEGFTQSKAFGPRVSGAWKISSIAGNANRVYLGGDFAVTDANSTVHQNLVALNGSGSIATEFLANPDTPVRALRMSNQYADGVWVGGDFQNVNLNSAGCTGCKNLALLTSSGAPALTTPGSVATDGTVNALATDTSGHIFVGGAFSTVGGVSVQPNLTKLAPSGTPIAAFNDAAGGTSSVVTSLATDDSSVFVGGVENWGARFPRGLAKLDAATSVLDKSFATAPGEGVPASEQITSLEVSGTRLYVAGSFSKYEGDAQRHGLVFVDTLRGRRLGVTKPEHDGAVATAVPINGRVLVGGAFSSFGNTPDRNGLALTQLADDVTPPIQTVSVTPQSARVIVPPGSPTTVVAAGGSGRSFQVAVAPSDPAVGDAHASGIDLVDLTDPFGSVFAPWWARSGGSTSATFTTNATTSDEDVHTLGVTTRDRAGNMSSAYPVRVVIDATPPSPALPTINGAGTSGAQIKVDFPATSDIGAAGLDKRYVERAQAPFSAGQCPSTDAGTFPSQHAVGAFAISDTWSSLATACHQIQVRSVDKVENESSPKTDWIPVDMDPPTGSIDVPFPRRVQPSFTVTGTARDAQSGLDRVTATVDGGAVVGCAANIGADDSLPVSFTCSLTAVVGAPRTVVVTAYDDTGRSAIIGTGMVTPDGTAPVLASVTVDPTTGGEYQYLDPASPATAPTVWVDLAQSGSFDAVVVATDDGPLGITASNFPTIGTNWSPGAGAGTLTGGTTATYRYAWTTGATVTGPLHGWVRDAAANETPFGFTVQPDGSDPDITGTDIPASATAAFNVEADVQDTGSGLAKYEVGLAVSDTAPMTQPICSQVYAARVVAVTPVTCRVDLPNGTFHVVVRATDHVGRVSVSRGDVDITGRTGLFVAPVDHTPTPLQVEEDGSTPVNERSFVLTFLDPIPTPADSIKVDVTPPAGVSAFVNGVEIDHVVLTQANATTGVVITLAADQDDYADGDVTGEVALDVDEAATTINGIVGTAIAVTRLDAQTAGVQITGAPTLDEDGNVADGYTIRLTSRPRADVTVAITPDPRMTATPLSMTFTGVKDDPDGWNVPRLVMLTPEIDHDIQVGGSATVFARHAITSGDGSEYGTSMPVDAAEVTILDDETASITLSAPSAAEVREAGDVTAVTFTATIGARPASGKQVRLVFSGNPSGQIYVTGDDTFTHDNWDQPHLLTVHAEDDPDAEPLRRRVELGATITTDDPDFAHTTVDPFDIDVVDDDLAALALVQGPGWITNGAGKLELTEGQVGAQLTIDVGGRPRDPVVITPTSSARDAVKFVPTSVQIDSTWDGVDPTFQISAVNNTTHEAEPVTGTIAFTVTTIDALYGPLGLGSIDFTVVDDDLAPATPTPPPVGPSPTVAAPPTATPPVSTTRGTKEETPVPPKPVKPTVDTTPTKDAAPVVPEQENPVAQPTPAVTGPVRDPLVSAPVPPPATARPVIPPTLGMPRRDPVDTTEQDRPERRSARARAKGAQPRTAVGRWAKEHKVAAASGATAIAVGVGAAVKAIAAKGLLSSAGGVPGSGHGLGSIIDKLHHLRHGRRLRRGGRRSPELDLRRKRRSSGSGSPRERSGMHRDIFEELDEKYSPKYEDPLGKFDDAA